MENLPCATLVIDVTLNDSLTQLTHNSIWQAQRHFDINNNDNNSNNNNNGWHIECEVDDATV